MFRVANTFWISDGDKQIDANEFSILIRKFETILVRSGVTRGDRVVIYAGKSLNYCAALLAVINLHAVVVPIFNGLSDNQIQHIVEDCSPRLMLINRARISAMKFLEPTTLLPIEDCPYSQYDSAEYDVSAEDPITRPAAIIYTSGSTGKAKGVVFSAENLILGARSVSEYTKLTSKDRILCVLPFSFDAGLNQFLSALFSGAGVILLDYLHPIQLIKAVQRWGVTSITAVPGLWNKLAGANWRDAGAGMCRICNTGGHLHEGLLNRLRMKFPNAEIYLMYGFTEAFRATFLPPSKVTRKPGSVGRSIPFSSAFIVSDEGKLCAPGEIGELVQCGPLVTLGYWNRPDDNRFKFRALSEGIKDQLFGETGGYYRVDPNHLRRVAWSGDLMTVDGDGDMYFVGRRDDLIKANGFRISPTEIETACLAAGLSAAVAFAWNEASEDRICVVGTASDVSITELSLRITLKSLLPSYMIPHVIRLVSEIPTTGNGKFDRSAVRALFVSGGT